MVDGGVRTKEKIGLLQGGGRLKRGRARKSEGGKRRKKTIRGSRASKKKGDNLDRGKERGKRRGRQRFSCPINGKIWAGEWSWRKIGR